MARLRTPLMGGSTSRMRMSIADSRPMTHPLLSSPVTSMNTALTQRQPMCRNPLSQALDRCLGLRAKGVRLPSGPASTTSSSRRYSVRIYPQTTCQPCHRTHLCARTDYDLRASCARAVRHRNHRRGRLRRRRCRRHRRRPAAVAHEVRCMRRPPLATTPQAPPLAHLPACTY